MRYLIMMVPLDTRKILYRNNHNAIHQISTSRTSIQYNELWHLSQCRCYHLFDGDPHLYGISLSLPSLSPCINVSSNYPNDPSCVITDSRYALLFDNTASSIVINSFSAPEPPKRNEMRYWKKEGIMMELKVAYQ
jgi:hypothetical protein